MPILAEKSGTVRYVDIELNETVREEDAGRGQKALIVIEHKGEKHPQIVIEDETGKILDFHYLPAKARIEVTDGAAVKAGQMLARQPRAAAGSHDITGGLPRVTRDETYEALRARSDAHLAATGSRPRAGERRGPIAAPGEPPSPGGGDDRVRAGLRPSPPPDPPSARPPPSGGGTT